MTSTTTPPARLPSSIEIATKPNYTLYLIIAVVILIVLGVWKWQRDRTVRGRMKKAWGRFIREIEEKEKRW